MMKVMLRGRVLLVLGVVASLSGAEVRAENIDAGKSGRRLFADSCAACHHSARGLTKGRFRLTLYFFLQQHYASNSSSAWELASYLESVDDTSHARSRTGAKHAPAAASKSGGLRPPSPIPQR